MCVRVFGLHGVCILACKYLGQSVCVSPVSVLDGRVCAHVCVRPQANSQDPAPVGVCNGLFGDSRCDVRVRGVGTAHTHVRGYGRGCSAGCENDGRD